MFVYIISYRDAIGYIFAKPIEKMFASAKVMVYQRVIQCTLWVAVKREVKCRSIDINDKFLKFFNCRFVA